MYVIMLDQYRLRLLFLFNLMQIQHDSIIKISTIEINTNVSLLIIQIFRKSIIKKKFYTVQLFEEEIG
jgi:hypothetical protein